MIQPNGQEYILDANPNRTTHVVVRKAPNIITITQRSVNGIAVVDLSDVARQALMELLSPDTTSNMQNHSVIDQEQVANVQNHSASDLLMHKRRGRPPKAA